MINEDIHDLEDQAEAQDAWVRDFLLNLPNIPHESVPLGAGSDDNPVVRTWGEAPRFDFPPKAHWDIGENLGILDFERAAKITGARFALLRAPGALLERALINFMLDLHTRKHGYTEVLPPFIVNERLPARHRTAPQIPGGSIQAGRPELFPGPHRRGAGDQHPPG